MVYDRCGTKTVLAASIDGDRYDTVLVALAIPYDGDWYDTGLVALIAHNGDRIQCCTCRSCDTVLVALAIPYDGYCSRYCINGD